MTPNKAFVWPGTSKKGRRTFTRDFKRELVEQTLAPGASISGIALANGLNANQLFAWRRKLLPAIKAGSRAVLLPVHLDLPDSDGSDRAVVAGTAPAPMPSPGSGHIEIVLTQTTVRLHGEVDQDTLRMVLQCLAP